MTEEEEEEEEEEDDDDDDGDENWVSNPSRRIENSTACMYCVP
jgi:hypothetical protein